MRSITERLARWLTVFVWLAACAHPKATQKAPGIGAAGGTLTTDAVTLDVPPGALASPQPITIATDPTPAPAGYEALGSVYHFGPDGLVFKQPVTVSIPFASATATSPTIYWSNATGGYDPLPTTIAGGVAQAQVTHFSSGFVANALSSSKMLTAFSFASPAEIGAIDESNKTISVAVPFATNVSALVASFATTGTSVTVSGATQSSGTTANDFTNPVIYTVGAADSSAVAYTVTVTVAPASAKVLSTFSLVSPAATGSIDEGAKTVAVTVPYATAVTALIASFTTTGASVNVGGTAQVSGTTPNDFTSSVTYTVVAADTSTTDYVVTVTVATCSCAQGQICNTQGQCVCDPTCGGCAQGYVCNADLCECQPAPCSQQNLGGVCPVDQMCVQGTCVTPACSQASPNGSCATLGEVCCNSGNQAALSCPTIGRCVCDTTCGGGCQQGQLCNTSPVSNFCGQCQCDITCGGVICPGSCDSSLQSATCGLCI